jgi:ribonuclease HI
MYIINVDASGSNTAGNGEGGGGMGVTVRDSNGVLLEAISYQVRGLTTPDDLECQAVLLGLARTQAACILYTDSQRAERWYNRPDTLKTTHYTRYLASQRALLFIHPDTVVRHVLRTDEYQRVADFLAKLQGYHCWDTPSKLDEFNAMYSSYQLSPRLTASYIQTGAILPDSPSAPIP